MNIINKVVSHSLSNGVTIIEDDREKKIKDLGSYELYRRQELIKQNALAIVAKVNEGMYIYMDYC